jgi:hypothetical protein
MPINLLAHHRIRGVYNPVYMLLQVYAHFLQNVKK